MATGGYSIINGNALGGAGGWGCIEDAESRNGGQYLCLKERK